jgi:cardiolipin synthase A/B
MEWRQPVGTLIAGLGVVLATWATCHALLYKRRPQSAFGWIAVCVMLPFAGPVLYYVFGINRVKIRAKKLLARHPDAMQPAGASGDVCAGHEPLVTLGYAVTGLPLLAGNSIAALHNGENAFPAMLDAIRAARRRVFLATYIFGGASVGQEFCAALGDAVRRGVDVRVLLDGVGELYSWPRARRFLARAGIRVGRFLPPRLVPPAFSVNLRNHRKILVVDGQTAFTGGLNIRERHITSTPNRRERIVDMHFKLRGPIVAQIEAVFLRDWQFVTGDARAVEVVPMAADGSALCRAVADGPQGDTDRLTELLVGAVGKARRRIAIMTPYFLPPRELLAPLEAAALQGIDVAVILPARNNLPYVHRATRHMLWELLERGARIYYQPPPFAHTKLLFIDDDYAQIGSANLDPRSLRLNFELNIEVYDRSFVARLSEHFEAVRSRSAALSLEQVDARPLAMKLLDGVAWLFTPYL